MVEIRLFENGVRFKIMMVPVVPSSGEKLVTGSGNDYRVWLVTGVTWILDERVYANISVKRIDP